MSSTVVAVIRSIIGTEKRWFVLGLAGLSLIAIGLSASLFHPEIHRFAETSDQELHDPFDDGDPATPLLSCPSLLANPFIALGFVAVLGVWAWRQQRLKESLLIPIVFIGPVYVGWVLTCNPYPDLELGFSSFGFSIGAGVLLPVLVIFLIVAVIIHLVAASWVWYLLTGKKEFADDGEEFESDKQRLREISDVAGDIADKLDDVEPADYDNLVIEAWARMVAPIEIENAQSATPREFAKAAIATGMEPQHVEDLTKLFEDVRYGRTKDDNQETKAVAILRRIETAYDEEYGENE